MCLSETGKERVYLVVSVVWRGRWVAQEGLISLYLVSGERGLPSAVLPLRTEFFRRGRET